jgi:ketosteroid isomerase-like protein
MSNEHTIRALIESWARAVSAGNRKAILMHHSPDLVMFDFPNEVRGLDAYDKTWDFFSRIRAERLCSNLHRLRSRRAPTLRSPPVCSTATVRQLGRSISV